MSTETETEETGNYINLAPTDAGYAHMAMGFAQSVLSDVAKRRKLDSQELLKSLVEIMFYLGFEAGKHSTTLSDGKTKELVDLRNQIMKNVF